MKGIHVHHPNFRASFRTTAGPVVHQVSLCVPLFSVPRENGLQPMEHVVMWFRVFCGNTPLLGLSVREAHGERSNVQLSHKVLCPRGSSSLCQSSSQGVPAFPSSAHLGDGQKAAGADSHGAARGSSVGEPGCRQGGEKSCDLHGSYKNQCRYRRIEDDRTVFGKIFVFQVRSAYLYPLCTYNISGCSQTRGLPVTASSIPVKCPVPNAASSLVSIPVKSCQLSFLRSSVPTSNPPTSVFVKL